MSFQELIGLQSPLVWSVNINDEEKKWSKNQWRIPRFSQKSMQIVTGMEQLALLAADSTDIVLLQNQQPNNEYIEALHEIGLGYAKVISNYSYDDNFSNYYYLPYLVTDEQEQANQLLSTNLFGPTSNLSEMVNNKIFSKKLCENLHFNTPKGYICETVYDFDKALNELKYSNKIVVKQPHGSSGKGLFIMNDGNSTNVVRKRITNKVQEFIIEEWVPHKISFNVQLLVGVEVKILKVSIQNIDESGVYRGSSFSNEFEEGFRNRYTDMYLLIGEHLKEIGYKGIVGIDGIISNSDDIYPLIEINGRFTQTTYLLPIIQRALNKNNKCRTLMIDSNKILSYRNLKEKFKSCWWDVNSESGIFIYNEACLPADENGRVFALLSSESEETLNSLEIALKMEVYK